MGGHEAHVAGWEPGARSANLEHVGKTVRVKVLDEGFEFDGDAYRSLSAVARAATGTRWYGLLFFGLVARGERRTAGRG